MRTLNHHIYYPSRASTIDLYYLTDMHIGARACDERLLQADVSAIARNPNARWIGGGDYIDCIARKKDKRYNESTLAKWLRGKDDTIGQQRDKLIEYLSPIADKCLGLVCGNHERAALDYADRDIYWEIVTMLAQRANVEPQKLALGVQGFVSIKFRRGTETDIHDTWVMNVFCQHGYGGGRLPGGHALTLGRVLNDYVCDIAMLGHRHTRQYVDKHTVAPNWKTRFSMALFVPSYLEAYIRPSSEDRLVDTYNEQIGLPPQHLGTVPISIRPNKRTFEAVLSSDYGIPQSDEIEKAG